MKTVRFVVLGCSVTLAILLGVFLIPHQAQAISTTWYVATTGADGNDCLTTSTPCATLNGALDKPTFGQGDTILVASGLYSGTGNTVALITVSAQLLGGWSSDFTVQSDLSTIDGENQRRGLEIISATVTLDHFAVQRGSAVTSDDGGGILTSNSIVTITESVIRQNTSDDAGAGVYQVSGVLNVHNSAFLENVAGNNVTGDGGALYQNGGVANFNNTTVSKNQAGFGGGAFGLYNYAVLNLNNTTVVSNVTPGQGGAITIDYLQGVVNLQNTILAGNQGGPTTPECTGPVHSQGYNLVGNISGCNFTSGPGDRLDLSPQLGILTGTVPFYDLSYTHPAVNKGNPDGCRDRAGNLLPSDQRGLPRVGRCDIGAIEFQQEVDTWYVALTGNDENNCLTYSTPCATINGALSKFDYGAGNTILVASGFYTGTGDAVGAITTSVRLLGGWNSDFTVQSDLSTIDGENQRRGLEIVSGTVTLERFIIQHGEALPSLSGGGLLLSNSSVTLTESVIRQNVSSSQGAGVSQVGGVLHVANSALLDNKAGNTVAGDGGALYQNGGVASLNNSTISGNWAGFGGGAFGLGNHAVLNLNNTTVVSNVAPGQGGAIMIDSLQGVVNLQNTILAGNQGGPATPECTGPVHSLGYNLVGNIGGCDFISGLGDRLNMNSQLGVLTGTIPYYDLFYNHPAVNRGNPDGCLDSAGNSLPHDQRGLPRVGRCDIGAIELQQEVSTVYLPILLR
ncbi:hypothetical protein TFLX_02735 [Thermoflexales bacterium]|nr:hypothetical protein TFLX_02735 [Thermoflexales bacterium]